MAACDAPGSQRGFALLIVLWSVVLLALIGTGMTASGRADVQVAANIRAAARAEAAADGAIQEAVFHLLDPANPWFADGWDRVIDVPGARVTLRIDNEAGKVNPNTAPSEALRALLQASEASAEQAARLAAAIVEWRFPRTAAATGPGLGAFRDPGAIPPSQPYRIAGLDYAPPGAPFESLDELGLVAGMSPSLLASLIPHLSLYNDADPDPAAADPVVRQALRLGAGAPASPRETTAPARIVSITAAAVAPGDGHFTRRATVRLGRSEKETLMTILTWTSP